jgi:hypothetical protein
MEFSLKLFPHLPAGLDWPRKIAFYLVLVIVPVVLMREKVLDPGLAQILDVLSYVLAALLFGCIVLTWVRKGRVK